MCSFVQNLNDIGRNMDVPGGNTKVNQTEWWNLKKYLQSGLILVVL